MNVTWIGHASFMLESDGYRVVIDPYGGVPGLADSCVSALEHVFEVAGLALCRLTVTLNIVDIPVDDTVNVR